MQGGFEEYCYWVFSKLRKYLMTVWDLMQSIVYQAKPKSVNSSSWKISQEELSYIRHRTSRSPIRRHLRPSALNPLSPMDPSPPKETPLEQYHPHILTKVVKSHPRKKKTLILDLDETLVHASVQSIPTCEFITEVYIEGRSSLYYVIRRPHLDVFLNNVSAWYHLAIYTASVREYADAVVSWLDQGRRIFKKRLFRQDCLETNNGFAKDLTKVELDISKVILLDNTASAFELFPDNAVPIDSWMGDPKDERLLDVLVFLDALRFLDDVRSILSLRGRPSEIKF